MRAPPQRYVVIAARAAAASTRIHNHRDHAHVCLLRLRATERSVGRAPPPPSPPEGNVVVIALRYRGITSSGYPSLFRQEYNLNLVGVALYAVYSVVW